MSTLHEIVDLRVFYRRVEGLHRASLEVPEGAIVTVIGPNGAGKSTLLGAVMGLLRYTGVVRFAGAVLTSEPVETRVQRGLCLVPERRELFGELPVEDNLLLGAFQRSRRRAALEPDLEAVYDRFPRLKERRKQLAGSMSGGEQQMLAIARALMAKPKLLLLDEPSMGLAPVLVQEIFKTLSQLNEGGLTIFLVEQNVRQALRIAHRGYVIVHGKIAFEGKSAAELNNNDLIRKFYLGL